MFVNWCLPDLYLTSIILYYIGGKKIFKKNTGSTAKFVAKYRPAMPIISLIVPTIKINKRMRYELQVTTRQLFIKYKVLPLVACFPIIQTKVQFYTLVIY